MFLGRSNIPDSFPLCYNVRNETVQGRESVHETIQFYLDRTPHRYCHHCHIGGTASACSPVLQREGKYISCAGKLKQIGFALISYSHDNDDWINPTKMSAEVPGLASDLSSTWMFRIAGYSPKFENRSYGLNWNGLNGGFFRCPSETRPVSWGPVPGVSDKFQSTHYGLNRYLAGDASGVEMASYPTHKVQVVFSASKAIYLADTGNYYGTLNRPFRFNTATMERMDGKRRK